MQNKALNWLLLRPLPPPRQPSQPQTTHQLTGDGCTFDQAHPIALIRSMDDVEESVGDQEDEFLSEQQEVYFLDLYNSATCSVLQASSKDLQEADEAMKKLGLAKVRVGVSMMVIINIVSQICLT